MKGSWGYRGHRGQRAQGYWPRWVIRGESHRLSHQLLILLLHAVISVIMTIHIIIISRFILVFQWFHQLGKSVKPQYQFNQFTVTLPATPMPVWVESFNSRFLTWPLANEKPLPVFLACVTQGTYVGFMNSAGSWCLVIGAVLLVLLLRVRLLLTHLSLGAAAPWRLYMTIITIIITSIAMPHTDPIIIGTSLLCSVKEIKLFSDSNSQIIT